MSSTPREIGTLIVVVLKANHLPNKRHIGKQDPYCVVTVNGEKRRTKAIKRGGQHPEWDEEIRFTLIEDTDDSLPRVTNGSDSVPPPLPPKDGPSSRKIKGGTIMKLACYADDAREPDLIGEANVDLTEVLTKGETDEWFNLNHKDKFAGKVYLELTFWSNEPPPEKKVAPKAPKNNKQYGGPGSFIPSGERVPGKNLNRYPSANANGPDLYVAPYEQNPQVDRLAQDFKEFGLNGSHDRRQSVPPVQGYSQYGQASYNGYPQDSVTAYSYDRAHSPNAQSSGFVSNGQYAYPGQYDPNTPAPYPPAPTHRHTLPSAPSGFVPLPQPSGFVPLQPQADTYASPLSHTPAPMQYPPAPSGFVTSNSYPPQTVSPVTYGATPSAYQQPLSTSQSYPYHSYSYPPPNPSAPPPSHYPPSDYPQPAGPPSQMYQQESTLPLPPPAPPSMGGSRPLPPQPVVYTQPPPPQQITSPPPLLPPQNGTYSPPYQSAGSVSPAQLGSSNPLPVPPPPPAPSMYGDGSNYAHGGALPVPHALAPPPPPPASLPHEVRQRRLSSLPQPPTTYQQSPTTYQPPDTYAYNLPQGAYTSQPGPPPQPPAPAEWTAYNAH